MYGKCYQNDFLMCLLKNFNTNSLFLIIMYLINSFVYFSCRAFDVEMLYIAQCLKIPVSEVAVNWTEIEG